MKIPQKHCIPCEGGALPIKGGDIPTHLDKLTLDWHVIAGTKIQHTFTFKNFKQAMVFVNATAIVAEKEGHHPDIAIHYNTVIIELWTHSINGLSENDFIMAARVEDASKAIQ